MCLSASLCYTEALWLGTRRYTWLYAGSGGLNLSAYLSATNSLPMSHLLRPRSKFWMMAHRTAWGVDIFCHAGCLLAYEDCVVNMMSWISSSSNIGQRKLFLQVGSC